MKMKLYKTYIVPALEKENVIILQIVWITDRVIAICLFTSVCFWCAQQFLPCK